MTTEQLKEALAISEEIDILEKLIKNSKNQKCEFIIFSFGNGSSKEVVCQNKDIIEKVRKLIILENEIELDLLRRKFSQL